MHIINRIYGSSDDLIEVEGIVREEFSATLDGADNVAFTGGTTIRIEYADTGCWVLSTVHVAEGDAVTIVPAVDTDDDGTKHADSELAHIPGYSGYAIVTTKQKCAVFLMRAEKASK